MNKKIFFAVVLCFSIGNISCYDYDALINEVLDQIDNMLNMHANATMGTFYSYQAQNLRRNFDMLTETVARSGNPYAIAHVYNFRKNYTGVTNMVENMINGTRDAVLATFNYQNQELANVIPLIRKTSRNINIILKQKRCNETQLEEFFKKLLYTTRNLIQMAISEESAAYSSQISNQYMPFMLFSTFIRQLMQCVSNPMVLKPVSAACFVQKDDMYLSATISLFRETLQSSQSLVENFNLKTPGYIVADVESIFNRAYKDALLYQC